MRKISVKLLVGLIFCVLMSGHVDYVNSPKGANSKQSKMKVFKNIFLECVYLIRVFNLGNVKSSLLILFLLFLVGNIGAQIKIKHSINPNSGNCNGLIVLTTFGDAGPFDVEIFLNSSLYDDLSDVNGIPVFSELCSGEYLFRITDAFGCVKELEQELFDCDQIKFYKHVAEYLYPECESSTGAIQVSENCFTGAVPPLSYEWESGEIEPHIFGLSAGTYALTVKDANDCIGRFYVELLSSADPQSQIEDVNGCNSPKITTNGVSQDFNFFWSDGHSDLETDISSRNGLPPGQYSVTVVLSTLSANSECAEIYEFSYDGEYSEIENVEISNIVSSCKDENTGSLDYNIVGGKPPYTIRTCQVVSDVGDIICWCSCRLPQNSDNSKIH